MIDWDRCALAEARCFAWPEVRAAWDAMDVAVAAIAQDAAKAALGHLAPACPTCACAPAEQAWISIGTSDAAWQAGDQRCGWLTLCTTCRVQVAFVVDDEMTESRRDGNW